MRLDVDCVRDVLLELESFPVHCHTTNEFEKSIAAHGVDNVEYTLAKLKEAGYINADIHLYPNGKYDCYGIFDITFPGHQFLETIRENRVWNKTKGILGKVGSSSFSLISQIATSLLTDIAGTYLKI